MNLKLIVLLMVIAIGGCSGHIEKCIEYNEPQCLPLPEEMLNEMVIDIKNDTETMMPNTEFEIWVEDGCIHSCEYKTIRW